MTNAITASAILNAALGVLWSGTDNSYDKGDTNKFACHAVTDAAAKLTGCDFQGAKELPAVSAIHAAIFKRIGNRYTVRAYLIEGLGRESVTEEEAQTFRKDMLEALAVEFEAKEAKAALLQRQIEVLEQVKVLRATNPARSNYVCDNIQGGVAYYATPRGLGLRFKPEADAICDDIKEYIGGAFSVDEWLGKPRQHEEVEAERIKMIDALIARYQAQLEAA